MFIYGTDPPVCVLDSTLLVSIPSTIPSINHKKRHMNNNKCIKLWFKLFTRRLGFGAIRLMSDRDGPRRWRRPTSTTEINIHIYRWKVLPWQASSQCEYPCCEERGYSDHAIYPTDHAQIQSAVNATWRADENECPLHVVLPGKVHPTSPYP